MVKVKRKNNHAILPKKKKNPIKLQTLLDLITSFYIIRCHTE